MKIILILFIGLIYSINAEPLLVNFNRDNPTGQNGISIEPEKEDPYYIKITVDEDIPDDTLKYTAEMTTPQGSPYGSRSGKIRCDYDTTSSTNGTIIAIILTSVNLDCPIKAGVKEHFEALDFKLDGTLQKMEWDDYAPSPMPSQLVMAVKVTKDGAPFLDAEYLIEKDTEP